MIGRDADGSWGSHRWSLAKEPRVVDPFSSCGSSLVSGGKDRGIRRRLHPSRDEGLKLAGEPPRTPGYCQATKVAQSNLQTPTRSRPPVAKRQKQRVKGRNAPPTFLTSFSNPPCLPTHDRNHDHSNPISRIRAVPTPYRPPDTPCSLHPCWTKCTVMVSFSCEVLLPSVPHPILIAGPLHRARLQLLTQG